MSNGLVNWKHFFKNNWIASVLIFIFFASYYTAVLFRHIDTDIQAHAYIAYKFITTGGALTPNFLYFIVIALFAGFSKYKLMYYAASVLVISLSLTAKYFLNVMYFNKISTQQLVHHNKSDYISACLMFLFCLPGLNYFENNNFLLGQLATNVWHNSTIIFLFPFAIMLFFEGYRFVENFEKKKILLLISLIVINVLIKPSFLFTIIPTIMCWVIFKRGKNNQSLLFSVLFLSVLAIILIFAQYFIIYVTTPTITGADCKSCSDGVTIEPFAVWKYYSLSMPLSFISSMFFPIIYFILSKGRVLKDGLVKFATINWLAGILIYILFVESGGRKYYGNFGWQMIIGNYLLFFVLAIKLFSNIKELTNKNIFYKILTFSFFLHFLWGVVYFFRILFYKSYF